MIKLLRTNFYRLKKSKLFYSFLIASVCLGAYKMMENHRMDWEGVPGYFDVNFLSLSIPILFFLSAFIPIFIGVQYSDGTVRNKLVIGHRRLSVYVANLLLSLFVSLVYCLSYLLSEVVFALIFKLGLQSSIKAVLVFAGMHLLVTAVFASIFVFVSTIITSKTYSAVLCILATMILLFTAAWVQSALEEPEYYDAYEVAYLQEDSQDLTNTTIKNPNYLDGSKRKLAIDFLNISPAGQFLQIISARSENFSLISTYVIIWLIMINYFGYIIFRKMDLK